jgi:hypothetical protein
LDELLSMNPSLSRRLTDASLKVYLPLFAGGGGAGGSAATDSGGVPFGTLRSGNVAAMSAWMLENHLIKAPITPARYGTNQFLPSG